ncbi:TraR/DksA family transcriptional regulator [Streptomyces celluloflavus]|uniref:TraR/DksA family transcriptional regulator n=1 Tax=Streptomyces celluloflavus TaxID=58344 RepID=UPI0036A8262C
MHHQLIDTGMAGLAPNELDALRENLEEQRRFRIEQLREFGEPSPTRAVRLREQRSAGQQEVHLRLAATARMVLADVEAALERMDRGRYGNCHRCARPIPLDRLEIVPQARYCVRCHQAREAER